MSVPFPLPPEDFPKSMLIFILLQLQIKSITTISQVNLFHSGVSSNQNCLYWYQFHFSHSVMSDSLWPHGLQHARLPCPSPTPRACSNSCPSSLVMSSNRLILCHPLLLLPSIFPSVKIFSSESVLPIRWPKYWTNSFSISSSNEYSGLIQH